MTGCSRSPSTSAAQNQTSRRFARRSSRATYDIAPDEPVLLGPAPAVGAFRQRYDRRQAAATVLDALDQLDRPGFHGGNVTDQLERIGFEDRNLGRQRDVGWEL